jgi:hypothetical protein
MSAAPEEPGSPDVLPPFLEEWAERARKAQEAVDAILAAAQSSRVPRMEVGRRVGGARAFVLVRSDPPNARTTTVWFTDDEWALITQAVLASHGLQPITTREDTP